METTITISPETGKPNPISLKEWYHMDTTDQKQFMKGLSYKEQVAFGIASKNEFYHLPKQEKQELLQARIDILSKKENPSLMEKLELKTLKSDFQGSETKTIPPEGYKGIKKKLTEVSSPYLIKPQIKKL